MAMLKTSEVRLPDDRPPRWANSFMTWVLNTRVLQTWVGESVAVLTFTGRRTGKKYTTPVSYRREGDTVTVITKRIRKWWHNFETPAEVGLRLAGTEYIGKAHLRTDRDDILAFMVDYLKERPVDAKAYGLKAEEITEAKIAAIVPHIVLIEIEVAAAG